MWQVGGVFPVLRCRVVRSSLSSASSPSLPSNANLIVFIFGSDRLFVAILYTSEVDKEMRYTDEGTFGVPFREQVWIVWPFTPSV